jgi:hypothetical protein
MTGVTAAGASFRGEALAGAVRPVAPVAKQATGSVPTAHPGAEGPSPFARLLQGLALEVDRGESLTRAALGASTAAHPLAPADLLVLQAGVSRYSEALDLAARLVDRATSSVKTVLQGQ